MSEPKHTPLPWKARGRGEIDDAKGVAVCSVHGAGTPVSRRRDFIVLAANSHYGLLQVCEALLEAIHETETDYGSDTWNPDAHLEITVTIADARALAAAIAKARGES